MITEALGAYEVRLRVIERALVSLFNKCICEIRNKIPVFLSHQKKKNH